MTCGATMVSYVQDGHKHSCVGEHFANNYHFCGECQRWWFKTPSTKPKRVRPRRARQ